jgi:CHAD domain-containing protein
VQLSATYELAKEFKAAQHFRRFLKKRELELRKSTRKETKHLRVKPLGKLIKTFREFTKSWQRHSSPRQASLLLVREITRAFDRTQKLKSRINPEDTHSIHCTRIAFKKFRYMVEALSTLPGFQGHEMLERFRRYQGLMGDIQDAEVLLRAFEKFVHKQKAKVEPALELTEALFRRRRQLVRKYVAHAEELIQFWPPSMWATGSINARKTLKHDQTRPTLSSPSAMGALSRKDPL